MEINLDIWRCNESVITGSVVCENPDIVDNEKVNVQQLVGKDQYGEQKVKNNSLGIPTTIIYGRKHYLLRGYWWAPPINRKTPPWLRKTITNWPDWL